MLIKCPECQKEISEHAKCCPHCGYPINETKPGENSSKLKSFTVAYRGGPGSIIAATIFIGILSLIFSGAGITLLAVLGTDTAATVIGIILVVLGAVMLISFIVYISYFVRNASNMSHNCIEYDAEKDKLVLCTLYGEIIEIDVDDYVSLKDNFFTDNMLYFTYKTKECGNIQVKLGYCSNRNEIRNNIALIKNERIY